MILIFYVKFKIDCPSSQFILLHSKSKSSSTFPVFPSSDTWIVYVSAILKSQTKKNGFHWACHRLFRWFWVKSRSNMKCHYFYSNEFIHSLNYVCICVVSFQKKKKLLNIANTNKTQAHCSFHHIINYKFGRGSNATLTRLHCKRTFGIQKTQRNVHVDSKSNSLKNE